MIRAFKIADVRAADTALLAAGEPLMERAAYGLANRILRDLRITGNRIPGSTVLVLAGSGNNGGDALYAGAYLARRGLQVVAVIADAVHQQALDFVLRSGLRIVKNPSLEMLEKFAIDSGIWVDGVLGIGASGAMRGEYEKWITFLSQLKLSFPQEPKVYAVDIPSGINADTGEVWEPVLSADVTVTMGCAKPGLFLDPAAALVGEVEIVDLGYERILPYEPSLEVIEAVDFADAWIEPQRNDHKYRRGVLGLFAGSAEFPGAPVLAAKAAANTGLGMLRYYGSAAQEVLAQVPEAVVASESSLAEVTKFTALVFGPGYSSTEYGLACEELKTCKALLNLHLAKNLETRNFESKNLETRNREPGNLTAASSHVLPVILDGGAMSWIVDPQLRELAKHQQILIVLTPHRGELAKLCTLLQLSENSAEALARETGCVVVDKGNTTRIVTPQGVRYTQTNLNPYLATAGSGDVLAGILGALLAVTAAAQQNEFAENNIEAAPESTTVQKSESKLAENTENYSEENKTGLIRTLAHGVYLHHAAAHQTFASEMLSRASDIINALPKTIYKLLTKRSIS